MLRVVLIIFLFGSSIAVGKSDKLTKDEAVNYLEILWEKHQETIRKERANEMAELKIQIGEHVMPFLSKHYGGKPRDGWSLFISLHGGGGVPNKLNNDQWKNQFRLGGAYRPKNAIYIAPRAPTNTWNLWHQAHIDHLLDRLIENLVVLEDVNPNAVYLMGYSAGGDGVYQLAPRMADRFAGAAMMAGHPNEASPLGLRNIAFSIHVGQNDTPYNRNSVAKRWKQKLKALHDHDKGGYNTQVHIHKNKGHWMNLEDRVAIPWLQRFIRDPLPKKVVWKQDDVLHDRFYWLALPSGTAHKNQQITASIKDQTITIEKCEGTNQILIRLNDKMLDLDKPIKVISIDGSILFEGKVVRLQGTAKRTFDSRRDKFLTFFTELSVDLKTNQAMQITDKTDISHSIR